MPVIATPPDAIAELTQHRGLRSKVFDLGGAKRRLITKLGRVHYRRDDNQLDDIETDTEVEAGTGEIVANKLPYRFRLRTTGIGFDYQSREDGLIVRKALTRIGATNIDQDATFTFTRSGNRVRYVNVVSGVDVIFDVTRGGVKTYWVPKNAAAPKSVRWALEYDEAARGKISDEIRGLDNLLGKSRDGRNRWPLNVSLSDGATTLQGNGRYRFIRTEAWTGEAEYMDPTTRIKSWVTTPVYPVAIDPDITEEIGETADDGDERFYTYTWTTSRANYGGYHMVGGSSNKYRSGWRFQSIALDNAVTIDSAVLKLNVVSTVGPWSACTIWGVDTDSSSAWSNSNRPSQQTKTTASASFTRPTGTGIKSTTVTSIIQEIVDRAGWASGGNISLFGDAGESGSYTGFEDYVNSGTNEPTLEIDYTAGGGGGVAHKLLTLGCG